MKNLLMRIKSRSILKHILRPHHIIIVLVILCIRIISGPHFKWLLLSSNSARNFFTLFPSPVSWPLFLDLGFSGSWNLTWSIKLSIFLSLWWMVLARQRRILGSAWFYLSNLCFWIFFGCTFKMDLPGFSKRRSKSTLPFDQQWL